MIAVALALLAVQAEATPPDVVVVAARLRRFWAKTRKNRRTGVTRCDIRRSSGDAAMDGALCDAVLTCSATVSTMPEAEACMKGRMPQIMARFAPSNPPDGWSMDRSGR